MGYLDFDLRERVAIVTGASQGIGREISVSFAKMGADVVLCSRNVAGLEETKEEIERLGRRALVAPTDISKVDDINRMVQAAVDEFGRIDVLVNDAAATKTEAALEVTEESWDTIVDVNLKGMFFSCQAAGRVMVKQKRGKIINIGSICSTLGLDCNIPYTASKGGVLLLTRALATEWAPYNINVNAIGPGYTLTDQVRWSLENSDWLRSLIPKIPMGRTAEVQDMVGAVVFLASDASAYITGQMIYVDGGSTAGWKLYS